MEGDGMVAVVRGLREAGLAVTLLDGSRQYTLLPNTTTQPVSNQRAPNKTHVSTQQCSKFTADTSTEPTTAQCDRDAQAVDGRYTSMYKTMHCNVSPTSPPEQLTEFPPQRPELYPGHGNFIVGGTGSGASGYRIRPSSPINSFRGGMSWPDRGSVCSPRPSRMDDAFARSLRKYPNCLSPDRSSEVMERIVNYSQAKGTSKNYRNSSSPSRSSEHSSQNVLESKATFTMASRSRTYEPDVRIRPRKNEEPPTRDKRTDEHNDKPIRGSYDVRYMRDMTKRIRDGGRSSYISYPYSHPVCPPTIREAHDYHPLSCDYQNSSNSVNMEIQAAVKMLSKEVSTLPRVDVTRKTVAVPECPTTSVGEDYVEGEFYYVENMDIRTSIKSIQTNFYPSDTTLKPRKSAQTVFSTIDFHSSRNRTVVSRKAKSQEAIKLTKDELKITLLELINEISDTVSKNTIRDELIKKLFDTSERNEHICDRVKIKHEKCHKCVADCCSTVSDYVGDYQELVDKLKYCYGDAKNVLRTEIKPFQLSEYRQLDFVLKDWVNHLNLNTDDIGRSSDRRDLLNSVEDRIKDLLKNWTKEDFDLKSEIVDILHEIPIEVNKNYGIQSYLRKLVDVLLKRMRNVIVTEQTGRVRRRPFASRSKKILTEEDMRDFVRGHLLNYANECNSRISNETLYDLENELVDLMMDSIECIWCGHDDEIMDEMEIILQDLGKISNKHANYISNLILQDLQDMINNCVFNQTYTILNVTNNSGQYVNSTNNTDFSIESINEEDLQANLDRYTNQLCLQINQWLDGLNIPEIQDSGFREVVVNDLAGDIIDRHKYVELNHTGRDSDQDKLEALKYQIFKWINKLVGDNNQETINDAETLLQRINSVPVPILVNPKNRSTSGAEVETGTCPNVGRSNPKPYSQPVQPEPCCGMGTCQNTPKDGKGINNSGASKPQEMVGQPGHGQQIGIGSPNNSRPYERSFGPASPSNPWGSNTFSSGFTDNLTQPRQGPLSGNRMGTSGTCGTNQPTMRDPNQSINVSSPNRSGGSVPVKKLNEDYDEYLKEWVKKIPIADKAVEEPARIIVYNGIWKAVTRIKLDPNIFGNQHVCQDVLEEEMEKLLQGVPQSEDLEAAKPALKAQLLQKTLAMNDLIKSTNAPASFKQQIMDNIENNLPERAPTENEEEKADDELDKQNMADFYMLYTRYKVEDNVKATVHRKNFLKKLDEYLNKIKNRHNLADMETTAYANEIINSVEKIPTPNLSAVKDEVDEILLAMEVENWISDIPQNTPIGPLEKRRTRDAIVKKIQEIGLGGVSCCDDAFRVAIKADLPKYLEKMPIQEGTDKEYLIDELANRIKNLSSSIRRVSFQEPVDYEEFSRNIPGASSMHERTGDRSSYLMVGENIVKCPPKQTGMKCGGAPPPPHIIQDSVPEEDIQWLSMDRTEIPSQMRSGHVAPQDRISPQVYNPNASGQMAQRAQSPQMYASNGPNSSWGSERAPVPQKRQKMSMQGSRAPPSACNRSGQSERPHAQLHYPNERSYPGQGNFGTGADPTVNWGGGQTPVPQENMQWYSMDKTEMPSQMRSMSTASPRARSQRACCQNSAEQAATQRSYPGSTPGPNIFNPNIQAPYVPVRDLTFPNAANQGAAQKSFPGSRPNWAGNQRSGPEEDIQWYSMEMTEMPSQMRSMSNAAPSARSPQACCQNSADQASARRSYPGSTQVPNMFTPNTQAPFGHAGNVPFSSFNPKQLTTQGQCPPNFQRQVLCTGPPCCPNPMCNNKRTQGSLGSGWYSQPAPQSPGPRGSCGQSSPQGFPNIQGSPRGNVPNGAQMNPLYQEEFRQGSPGRFNQSNGPAFDPVNVQNGSLSGGQMYAQGQPFQGPLSLHPQSAGLGQSPAFPNNTLGQSFGPNASCGQGSLGPRGQVPFQGPIAPQLDQAGQESCCQATPKVPGSSQNSQAMTPIMEEVIEGFVQGSPKVQPNCCQGKSTLNKKSQSPRTTSAASQISGQEPKPFNLKMMAGGQMGIFSTSQVPGPSSQSNVPTGSGAGAQTGSGPGAQTGSGPGASCCQTNQGVRSHAIPAIHITTGDRSIQQPNYQNQSTPQRNNQNQCMQQPNQSQSEEQPRSTSDKGLQAACMPAMFFGRPRGCYAFDRERDKERCKCMRRGRKFRPRIQMDANDNQMKYIPCRSKGHYPCFY